MSVFVYKEEEEKPEAKPESVEQPAPVPEPVPEEPPVSEDEEVEDEDDVSEPAYNPDADQALEKLFGSTKSEPDPKLSDAKPKTNRGGENR